ncbi:MAG: deoxyguanosinetriphosphate triphosphohydrolase [Chloroflexi bacterium]|nr:MAG: deoxyguanosinetriphosphate triphosphohydrolase [Chloroflexota bacterium]PIE81862.1 MAG: deoxyguanosinetriphosphate triphosphohydrolase [Chloroflexota bacterium]
MLFQRTDREELEQTSLAPYALKSRESKGRIHAEKESPSRTSFERDRDRIIHTTAFRRLEYKTQVFVFYEGDHYRTRLTHTLEVAQLGRSLARGLGCNQDLTEAICLAHDLGHAPFGHAGEHILNDLMSEHGGFNHNTQSYRIVTELEQRYPKFKGLNLTYETRSGMIKHETAYDKSDATGYEPEKRASLEAQISNLADEIAYNAHDLDDGLRAGLFTPQDLADLTIWNDITKSVSWQKNTPLTHTCRHEIIRELIGRSMGSVLAFTAKNLDSYQLDTPEKIQTHPENIVGYTAEFGDKIQQLKSFLYQRMYRHYRLERMQFKAERFISEMFNVYLNDPRMLPFSVQAKLDEVPLPRVITDYIAGMTDRFALDEWQKIFAPYERA